MICSIAKRAIEELQSHFAEDVLNVEEFAHQTVISVKPKKILQILKLLKEDSELAFDYLQDVCGVDYLNQGMPERFAVVYNLYSFKNNAHIRVKAFVPEENPTIDSVSSLWASADWAERETYDMYGIKLNNHPDMKRILLPDNYVGHPLRKDYPLQGRGERDNFPKYVS